MNPTREDPAREPALTPQSRITLGDGTRIPLLGLGTWPLTGWRAEEAVYHALKTGYRLIDTARLYGNEAAVGAGIRRAIRDGVARRDEICVTSKLMPTGYAAAAAALRESVRALGCGRIDLMLLHQTGPGDRETYRAIADAAREGLVGLAGTSNTYALEVIDRVRGPGGVFPAVVQNENHLYCQGGALARELRARGAALESWYPFGGGGNRARLFAEPAVAECAERHGKTPAQVILRWHLQEGFIAIPGSGDPAHIEENFAIFDFSLSAEEMARLAALDRGERFESW